MSRTIATTRTSASTRSVGSASSLFNPITNSEFDGAGDVESVDVALASVHGYRYVALAGDNFGFWLLNTDGQTWNPISGIPPAGLGGSNQRGGVAVKFSTKWANVIYALGAFSSNHGQIMVSTNLGQSWTMTGDVVFQNGGQSQQPRAVGKLLVIVNGATSQTQDVVYAGSSDGVWSYATPFTSTTQIALGSNGVASTGTQQGASATGLQTITITGYPSWWRGAIQATSSTNAETVTLTYVSGNSWTATFASTHTDQTVWTFGPSGAPLFQCGSIVQDPITPTTLYVGYQPLADVNGGGVYRIDNITTTPIATLINTSLNVPAGLLTLVESGATTLYVGCNGGIYRCINPGVASPTFTLITPGTLTDTNGSGVTFDTTNAVWKGIDGWVDGSGHTTLFIGAGGAGGSPFTLKLISGNQRQVAWKLTNCETGTPTGYLLAYPSGTGILPSSHVAWTDVNASGGTWWLSQQAANIVWLLGGVNCSCNQVVVDPNDQSAVYEATRGAVWHTVNASSVTPDWYPMVEFGASLNNKALIDPTDPASQRMAIGDTDRTLLTSVAAFTDTLTNKLSVRSSGTGSSIYGLLLEPTTGFMVVGGGKRNANSDGFLGTYTQPYASGDTPTQEFSAACGWPSVATGPGNILTGTNPTGVADVQRVIGAASGYDASGARVLIAIVDGGFAGGSIYRKIGNPGQGAWVRIAQTITNTAGTNVPSIVWPSGGANIYIYQVKTGVIFRSQDYGQTWASIYTVAEASDAIGQSFLTFDPTQKNRLYFTSRTVVYKMTAADGTPVVSIIGGVGSGGGNTKIVNCGAVGVDATGRIYVADVPSTTQPLSLWRSNDGGATWTDQASDKFKRGNFIPTSLACSAFGTYVLITSAGAGGFVGNLP